MIDPKTLAQELAAAYVNRQVIEIPPSARDPAFDLPSAYAVEAELVRLRQEGGHQTVGRKVAFANKAMWHTLKLDTLVWARMYDDTVRYADHNEATLPLARFFAPKIEPEIVFKMGKPLGVGELISSGALTESQFIAPGETWTATVDGISLPSLTVRTSR